LRSTLIFALPAKLVLLCFTTLVLAAPAFAFCTEPEPTVACEFLNSDAVFIGTVISTHDTPAQGEEFDEGWTYEMSVQRVFRGPRGKRIEVFTENNSARFPLDTGKTYLLFAERGMQDRLVIGDCGNSALLSQAAATIKILRTLRVSSDAEIEGRITFSGIPDTGPHVSGVHVVIQGEGKTYTAISDRDGWFHLNVPAGRYSAKVQPIPHWTITPFDLSQYDPKSFVADAGRCAGLEFWADSK
jgi:hypothetical protein